MTEPGGDKLRSEIVGRLTALGRISIPDDIARRHLAMIESVDLMPAPVAVAERRWTRKIAVGAAFFTGLMTGGMGLAAAGALPDSAQAVAHSALHAVGVDVPKAHPDRSTDGCNGGTFANHGQFVSSQPKGDRSAAAQSDCGKPVQATTPPSAPDDSSVTKPDHPSTPNSGDDNPGDVKGKSGDHAKDGDNADNKGDDNSNASTHRQDGLTNTNTTRSAKSAASTAHTTTGTSHADVNGGGLLSHAHHGES
jgi:hypothetical protein